MRDIQVLLFEKGSRKTAMFLDTQDGWPRQLTHIDNVLALQTVGGSGNAVYIFRFRYGKAMKVMACDASENMKVRLNEDGNAVTVDVPANPRTNKPAKHYRVSIE